MNPADWPPLEGIPECLVMWTLYDHPLDFPGWFVVRRCFCVTWKDGMPGLAGEGAHAPIFDVVPRLASSLAEARSFVPLGLYRQPRSDGDDPFIVEVWF
mgnify:CR=1 FL=1